jgi:hypothetical protein
LVPTDLVNPAYVWKRRHRVRPRLARLAWPLERACASLGLPLNRHDRALADLRNAHAGRRCFVLGNGPSLRIADLEALAGEITFASNKIHVAFSQTDWRPTYFVAVDQLVFENGREAIEQLDCTKLLPREAARYIRFDDRTVAFRHTPTDWDRPAVGFSGNALRRVVGGGTVTYACLQLAFHMGCREVYLVGVDHDWTVAGSPIEHPDFADVLVRDGTPNHFHPDYDTPGELWSLPRPDRHERAFRAARAAFEAAGGTLTNATRGGRLEVLPRADLDAVLGVTEPVGAPGSPAASVPGARAARGSARAASPVRA